MNIGKQIGFGIIAATSLFLGAQQSTTPPSPDPQVSHPEAQTTQPPPPASEVPPASNATAKPTVASPASNGEQRPAPAGPTSPGSAAPAPGIDNAHYIIGPEDALQITVWREPTLSGTLPVRPDGMISMVLLGDLPAAGMTPTQLGTDITQRLRKFVQDPSVTVQVMGVNSQRIYLVGEVNHVGPVNLSSSMTPLQAIASAGGLSPFANAKHIYILRGTGPAQQKIPFNYKQALKGEAGQPIVLRPGDTIVVP